MGQSITQLVGAALSKGTLTQQLSATFLIKVAGAALAIILQIALARTLAISEYGTFVYTLNWVLVLAALANLGMHLPAVRFIGEYVVGQRHGLLRGFIRRTTQIVLLGALVIGATYLATLELLDLPSERRSVMFLSVALIPLFALLNIFKSFLFAYKQPVNGLVPDQILRQGLMLLCLGGLWLTGAKVVAFDAMQLTFLTAAAGLGCALVYLRNASVTVRQAPVEFETRRWATAGFPFLFVAVAEMTISRTDILILGAVRPVEEVAVYAAAALMGASLSMVSATAESVVAPRFAECLARNDKQGLQLLLTRMTRYLSGINFFLGFAMLALGDFILGMFGKGFVGGYPALLVLVINYLFFALVGPVGTLMGISGNQRPYAIGMAIAGALNIVVTYALVSRYGAVGAALGRLFVTVLLGAGFGYLVWHRLGIMPTIVGPWLIQLRKPATVDRSGTPGG